MPNVYTCELKDKSGITHIYMRGNITDITDRIINYHTDDIPFFVDERTSHGDQFVHFILI